MGRICHLTSVHVVTDTRIFWRECVSAALRHHVVLIAQSKKESLCSGVTIIPFPTYRKRWQRMILGGWRMFRQAHRVHADVYHFHDPELLPWMALLHIITKKPIIYDVHEFVTHSFSSRDYMGPKLKKIIGIVYVLIERLCSRQLVCIVAASERTGRDIAGRLRTHPPIVILNNYPRLAEIEDTHNTTSDRKGVVYIGRISRERGMHNVIDAMQYVDSVLHLAGDYEDPAYQQYLAKSEGWRKIEEYGYVNRRKAWELLTSAQVGVNVIPPAPNHLYGPSNKIYEYMAGGLPIVASNFPMWKELVEDNGCGVVVNPLNPTAIADGINMILAEPVGAKRMGENGRRLVRERFNWEQEEPKLWAMYDSMLEKSR